jgi:hypothetical protein
MEADRPAAWRGGPRGVRSHRVAGRQGRTRRAGDRRAGSARRRDRGRGRDDSKEAICASVRSARIFSCVASFPSLANWPIVIPSGSGLAMRAGGCDPLEARGTLE